MLFAGGAAEGLAGAAEGLAGAAEGLAGETVWPTVWLCPRRRLLEPCWAEVWRRDSACGELVAGGGGGGGGGGRAGMAGVGMGAAEAPPGGGGGGWDPLVTATACVDGC